MLLSLPEDSQPVKDMFERFFAAESPTTRVRAAEPLGFDPALWRDLVALDAPFMRLSAEAGGGGMSLFDATVMMEQAGRRLAAAPLAESLVALRILGEVGGEAAREWIEKLRDGKTMLSLALKPVTDGKPQLVPGGAVAHGILVLDGEQLFIETPETALDAPLTLGGNALGTFKPGQGKRIPLGTNADAAAIYAAGIEEWKLLTAAALGGLADEAIKMAAAYATERVAFGQPIGTYQGISHPLANDIIDADGIKLLLWRALRDLSDGKPEAGAVISEVFWWAARTANISVAHALHTFGGYGLTNEYDIQLYHRRAKSWAQAYGNPEAELTRAGRRLYQNEAASLPDPGLVEIDFAAPDTSNNALAEETRAVFASVIDPARHRLGEHNFESFSWDVHQALGKAGLLFPQWPVKWGGRDADEESARAANAVWHEVGWAGSPRGTTGLAANMIMKFGTPALQDEVLLSFAQGKATVCLGYTEPSGGSDVFAAKTRAVRDGDDWIINGQKMFTSGAEWASYVLLLTRTNPDVPKHKGLTVFLVPLNLPGIEIHPVHTFMDERTNATFYADVRVPDRYRIGEVDGGIKCMSASLSEEQGGSTYHYQIHEMLDAITCWAATEERDGMPFMQHPGTLTSLAKAHAAALISEGLCARALWTRIAREPDQVYGPASKIFSTQAFIDYSAELVDLAAPHSLIRGKTGLGVVEKGYRHSTATSIYAGASEVLRSMIAERRLGMPRSRA
ncbi:acyl-CoA dehydrogenase [Acidocella sp.]|uniref:acyl-CoA dehydrogenase n=1 Tax=Acidocella sp. TaxID=50710 RepID=UPI00263268BA|nr:acyl-CoA dehydrogenase family protein [Acidocella sp.]